MRGLLDLVDDGEREVRSGDEGLTLVIGQQHVSAGAVAARRLSGREAAEAAAGGLT